MVPSAYAGTSWIAWRRRTAAPTRLGMVLAFKPTVSHTLAHRPARVVAIAQRFRSGDYLVTLEYTRPFRYQNEVIQRIDAFRSELYQVAARGG